MDIDRHLNRIRWCFSCCSAPIFFGEPAQVACLRNLHPVGHDVYRMDIPFWSLVPTITLDSENANNWCPGFRVSSPVWLASSCRYNAAVCEDYVGGSGSRGFGFQMMFYAGTDCVLYRLDYRDITQHYARCTPPTTVLGWQTYI